MNMKKTKSSKKIVLKITMSMTKGRGLPEITKLRSTATNYSATYREGVAADKSSKNIYLSNTPGQSVILLTRRAEEMNNKGVGRSKNRWPWPLWPYRLS